VLLLPIIPLLGEISLFIALISTWRQKYRHIASNPLNWGLAGLSLWLIINSCLAYAPVEAFLGLANFLPFFALFAALSLLLQQPSQLRRLAWLIVIPSLLVVILGLGQIFANWSIPSIFGWKLVPQGIPAGRMSSVFIYTNFLAIYLLIALILGWGLWLETFQIWRESKKQGWTLFLLTIISVTDGIGLVLTSSRSAWGIAVIAGIVFAFYWGWRWIVWGAIAAATPILWASFGPSLGRDWLRTIVPAYFWARLSDRMYVRPVETLRITQWRFCWKLIEQRPLVGWGIRNFTPLYQQQMNVWFGHPHNLWLMLGAEIGVVATLLFSGIVGWIIAQAVLLISNWYKLNPSSERNRSNRGVAAPAKRDRLILFTYIVAFASCVLFNLSDVTIFDLRVNTFGWILLSAISGVVLHQRKAQLAIDSK
jgi:O-antigen ligase